MLFFGSAVVDLTPPEPLPLGGYTERRSALFESGGDRLTARVRIIGDVVLVSAEMLTIPESLYSAVKRKSGEENLFLVATHTHCAPDSQMLNDRMTFQIPGISPFRRRWLEWYSDRIAEGIRDARQAGTYSAQGFSTYRDRYPLTRSRRTIGAPDNMATQVFVSGPPFGRGLFTIFGAHPTLYVASERKLRGDWPGEYMALAGTLAFPGAIGNASPVPPLGDSATPKDNARAFAWGLFNLAGSGVSIPATPGSLAFARERIEFPDAVPHPEFARANSVTDDLARSVVSQFAPKSAELTAIRIGDLVVIGFPGEPTGVIARQVETIAARLKLRSAVVSHANGWAGYMLDRDDYRRGGYEAQLSFYGENAGDRLLEATRRILQKLSSSKLDTAVQKLLL